MLSSISPPLFLSHSLYTLSNSRVGRDGREKLGKGANKSDPLGAVVIDTCVADALKLAFSLGFFGDSALRSIHHFMCFDVGNLLL